jgi:hypothetical protein
MVDTSGHRTVHAAIVSTFAKKWRTNMYPQRNPSDMSHYSTQQLISLERHQQMIDSALWWHEHRYSAQAWQEPTPVAKLRFIFATIVNIFVR